MYREFFSRTMIIAFAAAAAAVSGAAVAQNHKNVETLPANVTASNMTLDDAKKQYMSVWNQTEFNSTFSTFVKPLSAAGYGVYEDHGNTFRAGETIVLYVEPVGFDYMRVRDDQGNTLYQMNMTADYRISSANGTELQAIEDVPVGSIVSHRPNTELFLELTLTQASPFPAGDYLINYVVKDGVSAETFEITKNVRVAGATSPALVSAPPTSTEKESNCDDSYPDVCIPPFPPDLDCSNVSYKKFTVLPPDPHGFDRDNDGIGCET